MLYQLVLKFLLITVCVAILKVANYNIDPYASLSLFFGPDGFEAPDDCGDKSKHLSVVYDNLINRNVFVHTYMDNDRCLN